MKKIWIYQNKVWFVLIIMTLLLLVSGCKKSYQPESELEITLDEYSKEIVGYMTAGFLYNSQLEHIGEEEKMFYEKREEGTDLLMAYIEAGSEDAVTVNRGLVSLEMLILEKLDVMSVDEQLVAYGESVIATIFDFRLLIDMNISQLETYQDANIKDAVASAEIDSYLLGTTCDLINAENAYMAYLLDQLAYMLYVTAEQEMDMRTLFDDATTIYTDEIEESMSRLLYNYNVAADIHQIIRSADYYSSEYFFDVAKDKLKLAKALEKDNKIEIDKTMDIDDLLDALKEIERGLEEPEDLLSYRTGIYTVNRADDALEEATDLLLLLEEKDLEVSDEGLVPDFEEAMEQRMDDVERTSESINEGKVQEAAKLVPDSSEVKVLSKTAAQTKIDVAGLTFKIDVGLGLLKAFTKGYDLQYDKIINKVSTTLIEHQDQLTIDQMNNISTLIGEKLEVLLDGQKAAFVQKILNSSGDDLIKKFTEWKNNTAHFNTYEFTINDLVNLVNTLGITVEHVNLMPEVIEADVVTDVKSDKEFELFSSDYQPRKGQEVLFTLVYSGEVGYYEWFSGEGSGQWIETTSNEYLYQFNTVGSYMAEVKCYDSAGLLIGTATCDLDVLDEVDTVDTDTNPIDPGKVIKIIIEPKDFEVLQGSMAIDSLMSTIFGETLPTEDADEPGLYLYDENSWVELGINAEGILTNINVYDWSEADQVTYCSSVIFRTTGEFYVNQIVEKTVHAKKLAETFSGFSSKDIYYTGWYATFYPDTGHLEAAIHFSPESKVDLPAMTYYETGEVWTIKEIIYTTELEAKAIVTNYDWSTPVYFLYEYYEIKTWFHSNGMYDSSANLFEWIRLGVNRHGSYLRYHVNGSISMDATYVDGQYDGPYVTYLEDGGIDSSGTYVLGKMDGTWTFYDSYANSYYSTEYDMGERVE